MASLTSIGFKSAIVESIFNEIDNEASHYYFFFGRTQAWPSGDATVTPVATIEDETAVRDDIIFMKRITSADLAFMVPFNEWVTGTVYDEYDITSAELYTSEFYTITTDHNIYKCLDNNGEAQSTIMPFGTSASSFTLGDGYTWQYVCSVSSTIVDDLATATEYPVVPVEGADPVKDLFVKALCLSITLSLESDLNQGFEVTNDYRRVGILKRPLQYGLPTELSSMYGSSCYSITGTFPYADIDVDDILTAGSDEFRVIAKPAADPSPDPVSLLVQPLTSGDLVTGNTVSYGVSGQTILTDVTAPTVDKYSGILMFVDNRASFETTAEQSVQVKTIIRL